MTNVAVAVVLLSLSGWILMPDPHHRLRRLEPVSSPARDGLGRWVRGRQGAPPLTARILVGLAAGLISFTLLPDVVGAVALALTPPLVVVGAGQMSLTRRRTDVVQVELADTVELLAVCLSAGAPMRHALEVVASTGGEATAAVLTRVSGLLVMGIPEQQAWRELAQDEIWGSVACDVARSARSGTSLVEVLHVHAEEARLLAAERALQRARTAGVKSVIPLMACFLPAFVLVGVLPIIAGLLAGLLSPG